jgi:thiol-disulfide isomerase/thioredoxin
MSMESASMRWVGQRGVERPNHDWVRRVALLLRFRRYVIAIAMRSVTALIALAAVGLIIATVLIVRQNGSEDHAERIEPEAYDAIFGPPESREAPARQAFEAVPVPAFELDAMDGSSYVMEERKGKVVIINFWATWCGPCRFEIPELVELQDEYGPEGFEVLGISMDDGGFEVVRPFADEMDINYPIVVDHGSVASQFGGVYGLPTTFIVDRQGMIQERIIGIVTRRSLEPRIQILLSEQV